MGRATTGRRCGSIRLTGLLACALLLAGCSVTNLNITDNSAPVYSARAMFRTGGAPRGGGVELDYASVRGNQVQRLPASEEVRLGGRSVVGPTDLHNQGRVQQAHVVYNHLHFADRPVEMEWFVGAGALRIQWESRPTDPNQPRLEKRVNWFGPTGGALARWKLSPYVALEGRIGTVVAATGFDNDEVGYKTTGTIAVVLAPVRQVRIRAGYTQSTTRLDHDAGESELSLKLRGPFLGLGFEFH